MVQIWLICHVWNEISTCRTQQPHIVFEFFRIDLLPFVQHVAHLLVYKCCHLLGYSVTLSAYDPTFFRNILSPSRHLIHAGFLLGWFSTLKIEVIHSSKTFVHIWSTWHFIPEDGNIHNYCCENLKFCISVYSFHFPYMPMLQAKFMYVYIYIYFRIRITCHICMTFIIASM
jgi:hypothetical protein